MQPEVSFVVSRIDGKVIGCGAVADSGEGWAEIKRLFVSPAQRGQKIGRHRLKKIEHIAAEGGISYLRLETGVRQFGTLSLHGAAEFIEIGPFGPYLPDPLNVFMKKKIASTTEAKASTSNSGPTW